MSVARPVLPGKTYLVTRRCAFRMFWLRPSALTNQIVTYCLALAAERTGVAVHVVAVMSNHWHLVLTDTEGRLPEFLHCAHQLIAKSLNASYGRWENLWAAEATSVVELVDDEAVLDKMAYVIANPTTAGLVREPKQWPGVLTPSLGLRLEAKRPKPFFREAGPMPESVSVRCTLPDIFSGLSAREVAAALAQRVASLVSEAHAALATAGRTFLGVKGVLKQAPSRAAHTEEERRRMSPRVATKNPERRQRALRWLKAFWIAYRDALKEWRAGERNVQFPQGTYLMRVRHAARCACA